MSTAREEGLAALQSGDLQTAVSRLEAAVQEDPSDFDACLYLAGAYGKSDRPMDAIKSATQAVQLQPANAQARYNLGVAMEQGGFTEQALQVYGQAVQLQHDYAQAQEAVHRLEKLSNDGFGSATRRPSEPEAAEQAPQTQTQTGQQFAQPAVFGQQQPAAAQPQPFNPQAPTQPAQAQPFNPLAPAQPAQAQPFSPLATGQPAQAQPYNPLAPSQPTQAMPAAGQQPAAFGRPTLPVGQPAGEPGLGSYMAPPPPTARPPAGQGAPMGYGGRPGYVTAPSYDDQFKFGQAFKDMFRAMFTPRKLFTEMEGCDTTLSAWAVFLWYVILYGVDSVLAMVLAASVISHVASAGPAGSGGMMAIAGGIGLVVGLIAFVAGMIFLLAVWAAFAGIVHGFSRAFGSSLGYGASFRCVIYSAAPLVIIGLVFRIASMFLFAGVASSIPTMPRTSTTGATIVLTQTQYTPGTQSRRGQNRFTPGTPSTGENPFATPNGGYSSSRGSQFGTGTNPFGAGSPYGSAFEFSPVMLLALIPIIWPMITLGIAVSKIHQISGGAAAGVVIISSVISLAVLIGIGIVFGAAMAALIQGAMH